MENNNKPSRIVKGEPFALVQGNEETHRKAAEILDALKAGAPLENLRILAGVVVDPTPEQIAAHCRPRGLKPPATMPRDGWRSPIFMSAFRIPPEAAEIPEQFPTASTTGEIERPGVSSAFLQAQKIRYVGAEEAESLLDFRLRRDDSGLWIPYADPFKPGALTVNGRPFGRLRLDEPKGDAKYLSPKSSGAQLYVPINAGPFGKELVVCEGEFKACSLCEAGIRAVGIGGISSAFKDGELIPALAKLLLKWPPETVYFLGDADTALNFEFSREAVKLAKALPGGVVLKLPRIPFGMPKGVDDCREKLADGFPSFWEQIVRESVLVEPKLPAAALAVKLATRELPAIAGLENKDVEIARLCELGGHLDPLSLESLAASVRESLGLPAAAFKGTAKQKADERRKEAASRQQKERARQADADVADILNDKTRPKIEIPASRDRLSSEFARDLGRIIAKQGFFAKDGLVVRPDVEKACLVPVPALAFRTKIEDYVVPFKVTTSAYGNRTELCRTISREEADTVLASEQFLKQLPVIRAVNNVRLPALRASGEIVLLPEGYDAESQVYTVPRGPQIDDVGAEFSAQFLRGLLAEFPFQKDDRKRAEAVAISAMLTLFTYLVVPRGTLRPGFLYTANAEGGGKTLLARLAIVPRLGFTPIGPLPEKEEEIEKRVFASAVAASPVLFFDNGKRHISSAAVESAMTAIYISGRILGKTQDLFVENLMTVFLTGNGSTISGDLRRRLLHVELFLREARAEYRKIKNPLDEFAIRELRPAILSALWGITAAWARAGRPSPKLKLPGYEPWSEVNCGILELAGFSSPSLRAPSTISGDRDTEEIEKLVDLMSVNHDYRFPDLVDLCRENGLFSRLVGEEDNDVDPGKKNILSRIFTEFSGRIFLSGRVFHTERRSKHVSVFYVEQPT